MVIGDIQLNEKSGGKSGHWVRNWFTRAYQKLRLDFLEASNASMSMNGG
jgi:hypothetical protein